MLKIKCPYCGERNETEFAYGGDADKLRPEDPYALTDKEWAEYLYAQKNTCGELAELWYHNQGCRRWFSLTRNTLTNEITA